MCADNYVHIPRGGTTARPQGVDILHFSRYCHSGAYGGDLQSQGGLMNFFSLHP